MQKNLTSGNLFHIMITFGLPYLLSYFLQTLYGLADLYFVGMFHDTPVITAVSIGSQVMHMVTVIIVGLSVGTTVLISQAVGANQQKYMIKIISNTVILFGLVAVVMTTVLHTFVPQIVNVMKTPEVSWDDTALYLKICFAGIPFIIAYNVISAVFRGMGDSKTPMYFIALSCVVNIVVDYILIGRYGMGSAGAAYGTVVSQAVSVVASVIYVAKKRGGLSFSKEDIMPDMEVIHKIRKVGVPVACQDGLIQVSFLIITIIANRRGVEVAAAVGIVEKIIGILFLIPSTMMSTVSAIAAQNVGAGKHERAKKTLQYGIGVVVVIGVIFSCICQVAAPMIISLFDKNAEVVRYGSQYLRSYVWDCVLAGIHFCFSGYFCAYGYSIMSFIHNIASIVLMRVPGAYLASKWYPDDLFPMGMAAPLGSLLSAVICVGMYVWMQKFKIKSDKHHGEISLG